MERLYHVFTHGRDAWPKAYDEALALFEAWSQAYGSARLYEEVWEKIDSDDEVVGEACLLSYGDYPG